MSQDKEYIPEWKQPHIRSEAIPKYISFDANSFTYHVNKSKINYIQVAGRNMWICFKHKQETIVITGTIEEIKELHQSILDQLNQ